MVKPLSLKENKSYRFEQMKYSYIALSSNTRATYQPEQSDGKYLSFN